MADDQSPKNDLVLILLAFGATYIIWGSTYLFNKILVSEISPFLIGAFRFFVAGGLVILLSKFFKQSYKPTSVQLKNAAIAGFFFLTLGNGVAIWALQFLDSGLTALLISAQPLILIIMMWLLEGKRILPKSLIGIGLGILGIYLLVSQSPIEQNPEQWKGFLGIFFCLLCWSYGSLFVVKADLPQNYVINSGYQMLFGGAMMWIISLCIGEEASGLLRMSKGAWGSMIYLILFGSIAAFTAFNFLLKKVSPEKVATNTYVNPIVAMILGAWILHEKITQTSIIAAVVLLLGVYFINSAKRSPAAPAAK